MVRSVSYSSVGKTSTEGGAFVLPRIRGRNINVERRAMPRTAQRLRVPQDSLSVSLFVVIFVSMSSAGCVCLELLCQIPSCSPPGKKSFLLEKEGRYRCSTVFELDLLNTQEIHFCKSRAASARSMANKSESKENRLPLYGTGPAPVPCPPDVLPGRIST